MRALLCLCLLPLAGLAQDRADYAAQWALTLEGPDAGAYRVPLSEAVYRALHQPSLSDLEIFNAQGESLPAAILAADALRVPDVEKVSLPWFELPPVEGAAPDLRLIAERDADGSVRRVEARAGAPSERRAGGWLIDASRLKGTLRALEIEWAPVEGALVETVRIEGSDDLHAWRTLNAGASLLALQREGERLEERRIEVQGQARYLRLLPTRGGSGLILAGVRAERAPLPSEEGWAWLDLDGRRVEEEGRTFYEFELPGPFPVERVDVGAEGNSAVEWTLQSRAAEGRWVRRAGPWVVYGLTTEGGERSRSGAKELRAPVRDRLWRLHPHGAGAARPTLRLGYRPEVAVFLAQGAPPYALAAGSASARRVDAPLSSLLEALRAERGEGWTPAPALLSAEPTTLAGASAYEVPVRRDWKTWLLWSLLVAGAALVAGLAASLLLRAEG